MAGSSSGGTAHLYFAALAPLLNKYVPGMEASARSGGSTENVVLLERGTAQFACASPGAAEKVLGKDGMATVTTDELFKGKKVVLFSVPGAFTPTCDAKHLPGFMNHAAEYKAKGNTVACMAVNDA